MNERQAPKAAVIVFWPSGPVPCCVPHSAALLKLGALMGVRCAVDLINSNDPQTPACTNCENLIRDGKPLPDETEGACLEQRAADHDLIALAARPWAFLAIQPAPQFGGVAVQHCQAGEEFEEAVIWRMQDEMHLHLARAVQRCAEMALLSDPLRLRRKIVEAHADLLKTERIADLEAQVASLVEQVNALEKRNREAFETIAELRREG